MSDFERFLYVVKAFFPPDFATVLVAGLVFTIVSSIVKGLMDKLAEAFPEDFPREERKAKNEAESIHDKLKNEDLVLEEEKPKRGRMIVGDDGELLEIVEEEFEENG